jgi:hypothetical protein
VLAHPVFQRGEVTTNFIEREFAAWRSDTPAKLDLALIAAAFADAQFSPALSAASNPTGALRSQPLTTNLDPWQVSDGFRNGG